MVDQGEFGHDLAKRMKMPVICGPTAGGKSALAIALAKGLAKRGVGAQIVMADAFAIYKGMDIGTAKPGIEERCGIEHHLIDVVEPTERFSAQDWLVHAERVCSEIRGAGQVPIVVGGTHLYIKLLMEGMFQGPGADLALRAELEGMGAQRLRSELERVDPEAALRVHPNDVRRTVRAVEVFRLTGKPISEQRVQWDQSKSREDAALVCLHWQVESLNRRINARVKEMFARGLVEEVRGLVAGGRLGPQAREAIGYKQLLDLFDERGAFLAGAGGWKVEEAIERVKIDTRRFGKAQRTWLQRLSVLPGCMSVSMAEGDQAEVTEGNVQRIIGGIAETNLE